MQHEVIFPATMVTGGVPQGVSISLGNTTWWKLISSFYSFVIVGAPGARLFDMQVLDPGGNTIYQQRIESGIPNPSGTAPFVAQTIGGDQRALEDSLVTPRLMPATLLVPPNSSIRIFISSGIGPVTDTIAATIIAQDA